MRSTQYYLMHVISGRNDKSTDKTILHLFQIWDHNIIKDTLIGFTTLPMDKAHEYRGGNIIRKYPIHLKGKEGLIQRPGGLWLKVLHTENMHTV